MISGVLWLGVGGCNSNMGPEGHTAPLESYETLPLNSQKVHHIT